MDEARHGVRNQEGRARQTRSSASSKEKYIPVRQLFPTPPVVWEIKRFSSVRSVLDIPGGKEPMPTST